MAPYVLAGDNGTDSNGRTSYNPWTPAVGTHTVTATAFGQRSGGGTAGAPFSVTFTVVDEPLRAADLPGSAPNIAPGVNYAYYEGTNWNALPDFAALAPVRAGAVTGTAEAFTLAPRLRDDDFAFRYTGYLFVGLSGEYTFYTTSDDGSQLFIGNQLVMDNDGLHGA